jgi:hypothetical protein
MERIAVRAVTFGTVDDIEQFLLDALSDREVRTEASTS